jgi:hypothetical protein
MKLAPQQVTPFSVLSISFPAWRSCRSTVFQARNGWATAGSL